MTATCSLCKQLLFSRSQPPELANIEPGAYEFISLLQATRQHLAAFHPHTDVLAPAAALLHMTYEYLHSLLLDTPDERFEQQRARMLEDLVNAIRSARLTASVDGSAESPTAPLLQ